MGFLSSLWKNWGKSANTLPSKTKKEAKPKLKKLTKKKTKKSYPKRISKIGRAHV